MKHKALCIAFLLLAPSAAVAGETPAEKRLRERLKSGNGISVGEPKVYDDSALQQMLAAVQARLASLQLLDSASILGRAGGLSGVTQRVNSFNITAQTPALPQVVTTDKGPTGSTVTTTRNPNLTEATTGATPSMKTTTGTDTTTQETSGLATRDVATTSQAFNAPAPTPAPASIAVPSAVGVSASDLLNEQLQLTYELTNLRLLLDGALSDRMIRSSKLKMVKPRATIGFPIALAPDKRHKNAVAIVEVEVEKEQDIGDGEPPVITALLPREKTYNVASITESNVQIGGGIVTQVAGVGGSWLSGRKTYYVVQDQDTLALPFPTEDKMRAGFLWQFRPVLGREYVRQGEKFTFVQLAFPSAADADFFGKVHVRSYWRKYDRSKGLLGDIVRDSLREEALAWDIRNYRPMVFERELAGFGNQNLEDAGDGQVLVKLYNSFPPSTYVRIGNTIVKEGSGLTLENSSLRFAARLTDAVTKKVMLVARDGSETQLVLHRTTGKVGDPETKPAVARHQLSTLDEANTLVTVELKDAAHANTFPPLVLLAGGKVYGYSDAPIQRSGKTLSAVIPTAALLAQPEVTVTWLFANPQEAVREELTEFSRASRTEQLVILEQRAASAIFLLYGSRLEGAKLLGPYDLKLNPVGGGEDGNMMRLVEITADQLKTLKRLVLARPGGRPNLIEIPAVEFKSTPKKELKPKERVSLGSDEAVFEGEGLEKLKAVLFGQKPVPFMVAPDHKSVRLTNLRALGVTVAAAARELSFVFDREPTNVNLEVVNGKVETVPKP